MTWRGILALGLAITFAVLGWHFLGGGTKKPPVVPIRPHTATRPSSTTEIMDPTNAVAQMAFVRASDTAVIDGKTISFPALYLAADRSEANAAGEIVVTLMTFLTNPRPRSAAEIRKLLTVDESLHAEAAMKRVRSAFGATPGFEAGTATLHARETARKLTDITGMSLRDGVRVWLADPSDPDEDFLLVAEDAELTCESGVPVKLTTRGRVEITRPKSGDASVVGVGLIMDLREGTLLLERDILITLRSLVRGKPLSVPVVMQAGGPLILTPERTGTASRPKDARRVFKLSSGVAQIGGGATLTQGATVAKSAMATLELSRGRADASTATMEGNVSYESGPWAATAQRLRAEPSPMGTKATLEPTLGGVVVLKVTGGASLVPRATKAQGDLIVTSKGSVVVTPVAKLPDGQDVPAVSIHEVRAGPDVVMTAATDRITAKELRIWFGDVAIPSAAVDPKIDPPRRRVPVRAYATMAQGETDGYFLRAREWYVRRTFDPDGVPLQDRLTFKGDYEVVMKDVSTAKFDPSEMPGGARNALLLKPAPGDRLILTGGGTLDLLRAPLENAPSTFNATDNVEARLESTLGGPPRVLLTAHAIDALVTPVVVSTPQGNQIVHRLESLAAVRNVALAVDGGIRARGYRLKYDPSIDELELVGSNATDRARIEVSPKEGAIQGVRAQSMVWQGKVARLIASGNVEGELMMVRLPWADDIGKGPAVRSFLQSDKISVLLDPSKIKTTGFDPLSIHAEGRVRLEQPDRIVNCTVFDFDPRTRSGTVLGRPVTYEVTRAMAGGPGKDFVSTALLVFDRGSAIAQGPVHGVFHADRRQTAFSLPQSSSNLPSAPIAPASLTPMVLACRGPITVSPDRITLTERVEVTQGDPNRDGYHVEADYVMFELASVATTTEVAFAVLQGSVIYVSKELEGRGDVMVLDRARKTATLKADSRMRTGVYLRVGDSVHAPSVREQGSRLDIDFADPRGVQITSWDGRGSIGPDTRRAPR